MTHPEGPFQQAVFDHRQHVKFAWSVVREHGAETGERLVAEELGSFAAQRAPGKYHQTMTTFWVRLVAHTVKVDDSDDFDQHVTRFPILLDKTVVSQHYSAHLLASPPARKGFLAPDLAALP